MNILCAICSCRFDSSHNITALHCGHLFHEDCIMKWLQTKLTCPCCRAVVRRNEIIKHLFLEIQEDTAKINMLENQIRSLQAQIKMDDKQKHELAWSRDFYVARFKLADKNRDELRSRYFQEIEASNITRNTIKRMEAENSAFREDFEKTQKHLVNILHNVESQLKDCVPNLVLQCPEPGESLILHLASLLAIVKKEYNQVLADKKGLSEQISDLNSSRDFYYYELERYKMESAHYRMELKKTQETLSLMERETNELRRQIGYLRSVQQHNITTGNQSSSNEENLHKKRKLHEHLNESKCTFSNMSHAGLEASKSSNSEKVTDFCDRQIGTFVHTQDQRHSLPRNLDPKKDSCNKSGKTRTKLLLKQVPKQRQLNNLVVIPVRSTILLSPSVHALLSSTTKKSRVAPKLSPDMTL